MNAERPRIEGPMFLRREGEGDEATMVPCKHDEASMTQFVFTAVHPVDSHEFGLMATLTEVTNWPGTHVISEMLKVLADYMKAHPDGDFCDDDDCEHNKGEEIYDV